VLGVKFAPLAPRLRSGMGRCGFSLKSSDLVHQDFPSQIMSASHIYNLHVINKYRTLNRDDTGTISKRHSQETPLKYFSFFG